MYHASAILIDAIHKAERIAPDGRYYVKLGDFLAELQAAERTLAEHKRQRAKHARVRRVRFIKAYRHVHGTYANGRSFVGDFEPGDKLTVVSAGEAALCCQTECPGRGTVRLPWADEKIVWEYYSEEGM